MKLRLLAVLATVPLLGSSPASGTWERKSTVTSDYVRWFVEHQSDDPALADQLAKQFGAGWEAMRTLFAAGKTSAEVAAEMRKDGFTTFLLGPGYSGITFPGHTASFLIMDREAGCKQITLERWTTTAPDKSTNLALIGMGNEDVKRTKMDEKQLHIAAMELPRFGDYLEINTNSLSPLGKGIIAFVAVGLLTGCPGPTAPASPPPPPPAPPPPPPPTVTVNPTGTSSAPYITAMGPAPLGPSPGAGKLIELPPQLGGGVARSYTWIIEIVFPAGTPASPNHVHQYKRDTVTYGDGTSEIDPQPGGFNAPPPGGFDQPPDGINPATQTNGNGTKSYLDAPGILLPMPIDVSKLPIKKRTKYRWVLHDNNHNQLDCRESTYNLDIDRNGMATYNFTPAAPCQ
jgi:hypothetical protein